MLERLSDLVLGAVSSYDPRDPSLPYLLNGLAKWKGRPLSLAQAALNWSTTTCKKIKNDDNCTRLIVLALQIGFRRSNPDFIRFVVNFDETDHQRMVGLVFGREDHETVADALCAWISVEDNVQLLRPCVEPLVKLALLDAEFPPRLNRAIIHAVNLVDFVKEVEVKQLTRFLVRLKVGIDDIMDARDHWTSLILKLIASEEGREYLELRYWELLVRLVGKSSCEVPEFYDEAVLNSLVKEEKWGEKLVCWLGVIWSLRPPGTGGLPVEVVANATTTLVDLIPTAAQRLRSLVVDSVEGSFGRIHKDEFEQACGHGVGAESHP